MYFNTVHVKKAVALLSRLYWTCSLEIDVNHVTCMDHTKL